MDAAPIYLRNSHVNDALEEGDVQIVHVWVDGLPWTVATDGHMAFAVSGLQGEERFRSKGHASETRTALTSILAEACAKSTMEIDLDSLAAFTGKHVPDVREECSACDGTGEACSCGECDCKRCGGDGGTWKIADKRYGYVFDRIVDLNRLARLLADVERPVRAHAGGAAMDPLFFAGPSWCAITTACNPKYLDAEMLATAPRWDARCTL